MNKKPMFIIEDYANDPIKTMEKLYLIKEQHLQGRILYPGYKFMDNISLSSFFSGNLYLILLLFIDYIILDLVFDEQMLTKNSVSDESISF